MRTNRRIALKLTDFLRIRNSAFDNLIINSINMTFDYDAYAFGDFVVNPQDRLLIHSGINVPIAAKDFDLLTYLVKKAGQLVTEVELRKAIWNNEAIHPHSITNHISKIRRALGCDPISPKFIKTLHGKRGYRFIAEVRRIEPNKIEVAHADHPRQFTVDAHLFSPVYFGIDKFRSLNGNLKKETRGIYKEITVDNGRLCLFPSGIGVWHLSERRQISAFDELATWRAAVYEEILTGRHKIGIYNDQYTKDAIKGDPLAHVMGKPGYVLSLMVLKKPGRVDTTRLLKPLRLLACLAPLEQASGQKSRSLEKDLLSGLHLTNDLTEFGMSRTHVGYASWDGISYLDSSDKEPGIKNDIIEFEVALQAAWWLCKCIYDLIIARGGEVKNELQPLLYDLRRQVARLHGILATESVSQRTMTEAILKTSRIDLLFDDTVKMYDEL